MMVMALKNQYCSDSDFEFKHHLNKTPSVNCFALEHFAMHLNIKIKESAAHSFFQK